MALYKEDSAVEQTDDGAFDVERQPGERVEYAGIYGCLGCGREVVCAEGAPLPGADEDHEHPPGEGDFRWRLLVNADAEPKSGVGWVRRPSHKR